MRSKLLRGDGGNKPVTEESAKETVKTIAQGRPGVPVRPWSTTVCFLLCTRGCGCSGRPVFPCAPLGIACALRSFQGQLFPKPGRMVPRDRGFVSMFHRVRSFRFRPSASLLSEETGFHPASSGLVPSESCFGTAASNLCSRSLSPQMPAWVGQLQFGHEANSGFRLGPGAYTLPYSPKIARDAAKPPQ